jgi:hypothetical protein
MKRNVQVVKNLPIIKNCTSFKRVIIFCASFLAKILQVHKKTRVDHVKRGLLTRSREEGGDLSRVGEPRGK